VALGTRPRVTHTWSPGPRDGGGNSGRFATCRVPRGGQTATCQRLNGRSTRIPR
jgi:hypothetical protein